MGGIFLSSNDIPESTDNVLVYPNPADKTIFIESEATFKEIYFFDCFGKSIAAVSLGGNSIDVSHLPSGIYFLKMISDDFSVTKRILVN
jgi:hypothetical protein